MDAFIRFKWPLSITMPSNVAFVHPGMILTAYSLLLKKPAPTEADIIEGMEENLCRCGGYQRIVQAIQTAAKQMRG